MSSLTLAADHFLAIVSSVGYEAGLRHAMQRYGVWDREALLAEIARLDDARHQFALAEAL